MLVPVPGPFGGTQYINIPDATPEKDPFKEKFKNLPDYPAFSSIVDEKGNLKDGFSLSPKADIGFTSNLDDFKGMLDPTILNLIKSRATATGPTDQANYLLQRQGIEQADSLENLVRQGSSAAAAARGSLARSGGLTSGARERLANRNALAMLTGRQQNTRQGQLDRLGILSNDEGQKTDLLKSIPGFENQRASTYGNFVNEEAGRRQALDLANRGYQTDIEKTNLASRLANQKSRQEYDLGQYSELMKGYAANRQAEATENSGKK